jgi:hypothetical protein
MTMSIYHAKTIFFPPKQTSSSSLFILRVHSVRMFLCIQTMVAEDSSQHTNTVEKQTQFRRIHKNNTSHCSMCGVFMMEEKHTHTQCTKTRAESSAKLKSYLWCAIDYLPHVFKMWGWKWLRWKKNYKWWWWGNVCDVIFCSRNSEHDLWMKIILLCKFSQRWCD